MSEPHDRQREFFGQDVRQGEIILRTSLRKTVFIAGLAGFVLVSAMLALSACIPTA